MPTAVSEPIAIDAITPRRPSRLVVVGLAPIARMTRRSSSSPTQLTGQGLDAEEKRRQPGNAAEDPERERLRSDRLLRLGLQVRRDLKVGEVVLARGEPLLDIGDETARPRSCTP